MPLWNILGQPALSPTILRGKLKKLLKGRKNRKLPLDALGEMLLKSKRTAHIKTNMRKSVHDLWNGDYFSGVGCEGTMREDGLQIRQRLDCKVFYF